MTGLTDIARAARVSIATVSRVVNEPEVVSERTRTRVQRAMARLGYQPNRVARRLRQRGGRRQLIGLIIPEIENSHFSEIVRGVEDAAHKRGIAVMLCNSDDDPAKERFYLDILRAESVDGVIAPPIHDRDPALLAAAESGLPLVVIDRRLRRPGVDSVRVDNRLGARIAVEHLLDRGHTRIAHISGPARNFTSRERREAWSRALEDRGFAAPRDYLWQGDNRRESGVAGAEALLSLPTPPQAIFVANNLMSIGVLEVIHGRGLAVPADVAVVGFDDPPWAQALRPALTSVRQPTREMGRVAVELLTDRLEHPRAPVRSVMLEPELMVRDST
jgi:LacI family transcriptional regulator/LacI family repressor for deo operon, udp, cdd, tsx, nupC, and nupG